MKLTPRIRGIVYVVLVIAGVLAGVGQALAPDVAAEAAPVAGGWIDTILAVIAVVGGILARLNLTPAPTAPLDPTYIPPVTEWPVDDRLADIEREADEQAALHNLTPGAYLETPDRHVDEFTD